MLVFVSGGLAYADLETRGTGSVVVPGVGSATFSAKRDNWKAGWTVGGGMEWLMGNKTTFKGEYLYYDLNDTTLTVAGTAFGGSGSATYKNENTGHIVRMGLNVALY